MQVTNSVWSTGVLNPGMRVFDVVMRTEYGTSYNSFVVKGSNKIAVIEGSHKSFGDWFEENLKGVLDGRPVDYLVLNHTEPDHSGCVAEFLAHFPDVTLVLSQGASVFIKNITNIPDLKMQVVKDGDSIDLGDKTLQFISAPFLHWPDTMFTYLPEEKVLFPCDFLGTHYCEPQMLDTKVVYPDGFWAAVKNYYDCIMAPFAPYVRQGLDKVEALDVEYACVSHGPILTKGCSLEKVIALYREWSAPKARGGKLIPLFYCTAYGNTARLAQSIRAGILRALPDAEVDCYNVIEHDMAKLAALLNESDAFCMGTLTINRAPVPPLWQLVGSIDAINIAKRPVALFGTYGWSGDAFAHIGGELANLKAALFEEPFNVQFVPSEADLQAAEAYGERFAKSLG